MAKRNVQCVKPSDPPFLRKLKEQCGYSQTTIETKKQALQMDPEADKDNDDELPQVVVLRPGDLSQDEAHKILKQDVTEENADDETTSKTGSRMQFSTKTKRTGAQSSNESSEQKKKKLQHDLKKKNNVKAVKNSNLLSFDEDGDEEEY